MNHKRLLEDYTLRRAIIDDVKIAYYSTVKCASKRRIFIPIPDKIRREMRIGRNSEYKFKVIILRID